VINVFGNRQGALRTKIFRFLYAPWHCTYGNVLFYKFYIHGFLQYNADKNYYFYYK